MERQALIAMARRMPDWVTPDRLTAFGVFGGLLVAGGYALSNYAAVWLFLSNIGLIIHWFGDSMDGTLARVRDVQRPRYGFFVDQSVDVLINFVICGGIALSVYASFWSVLLVLTGYHMLAIYSLLRNAVANEFQVSMAGFGPTELRLILFVMNTALFFFGAEPGFLGFAGITWVDGLMVAGFFIMLAIYISSITAYGRRLAAEENAALRARRG